MKSTFYHFKGLSMKQITQKFFGWLESDFKCFPWQGSLHGIQMTICKIQEKICKFRKSLRFFSACSKGANPVVKI